MYKILVALILGVFRRLRTSIGVYGMWLVALVLLCLLSFLVLFGELLAGTFVRANLCFGVFGFWGVPQMSTPTESSVARSVCVFKHSSVLHDQAQLSSPFPCDLRTLLNNLYLSLTLFDIVILCLIVCSHTSPGAYHDGRRWRAQQSRRRGSQVANRVVSPQSAMDRVA
jgi:hypothetical protein